MELLISQAVYWFEFETGSSQDPDHKILYIQRSEKPGDLSKAIAGVAYPGHPQEIRWRAFISTLLHNIIYKPLAACSEGTIPQILIRQYCTFPDILLAMGQHPKSRQICNWKSTVVPAST